MSSYEIVSVNVGRPKVLLEYDGGQVVSGIDKRPVDTATIALGALNLEGDGQADQRVTAAGGQVHGGPDKAVYALPSEHFARLTEIVGSDVGPGFMGENVTLAGALEDDVCVGDVWQWGDARLQVTSPRGPCYKLGIRIGRQATRTAIREEGLVGWYLCVLTPGTVPTTGAVTRVEQHPARVSIAAVHAALQDRGNVYPDLARLEALGVNVRAALLWRDRDLSGGVPESDG